MNEQPAERVWAAMKRMAADEKRKVSSKQAIDRVRSLVVQEGASALPERVLHFYAEEYLAMVRRAHPED